MAVVTFILLLLIPSVASPLERVEKTNSMNVEKTGKVEATHYWALLVAVGVYAYNPSMDRPSMLSAVDDLYHTLIVSPFWNESHIKVIKGKNATVLNIMAGFSWLAKNAKENDVCLVYLTSHGFPIFFDLPPRDEADGMDEALAAYRGFLPIEDPFSWEPLANPFGIITDDEINFMLNRIHAKGIAMIVDSCHSGGFNDNWSYAKDYNFATEFAKDLEGRNRVILTSVREDEISFGSIFSYGVIDALKGYGDKNKDGFVSAEEAFYFARSRVLNETRDMHPQLFDDYKGEIDLTQVELPPSMPIISGTEVGETNKSYTYEIKSYDPEGDKIKYEIDWGNGKEETQYFESGEIARIEHSWKEEGTYEIKVRAIDEHGAYGEWNESIITMAYPWHKVDQRQVNTGYVYLVNSTRWLSQSFIPSMNDIEEVELPIICWQKGSIVVELRDGLNGNIIAKTIKEINATNDWVIQWIRFDLKANLTPDKKYYIVCHGEEGGWRMAWVTSNYDSYAKGEFYQSRSSGENWQRLSIDACFVTYA